MAKLQFNWNRRMKVLTFFMLAVAGLQTCNSKVTILEQENAIAGLRDLFSENPSFIPASVRMIFHDCAESGCDGCLDTTSRRHSGLGQVVNSLTEAHLAGGYEMSRADFFALAGTIALHVASEEPPAAPPAKEEEQDLEGVSGNGHGNGNAFGQTNGNSSGGRGNAGEEHGNSGEARGNSGEGNAGGNSGGARGNSGDRNDNGKGNGPPHRRLRQLQGNSGEAGQAHGLGLGWRSFKPERIPLVYGRGNCDPMNPKPLLPLPPPFINIEKILELMGPGSFLNLTVHETIALIGGGHSLGGAKLENTGFSGSFTSSPLRFNNDFFRQMKHGVWSQELVREGGNKYEYYPRGSNKGDTFMLTTDVAMRYGVKVVDTTSLDASQCHNSTKHPECEPSITADITDEFASNPASFLFHFENAFTKLILLGNPDLKPAES